MSFLLIISKNKSLFLPNSHYLHKKLPLYFYFLVKFYFFSKGVKMTTLYPLALLVHLFCAIFFVGYFLIEIVLLKAVYPKLTPEAKSVFGARKVRMIFISLLVLFVSGGVMASMYIGGENGYMTNSLQTLLCIKIALSVLLLALVLYWYIIVKVLQKPLPFKKLMHPLTFILLVAIVVISKLMVLV